MSALDLTQVTCCRSSSRYTKLCLTIEDRAYAAVPLASRQDGLLVATLAVDTTVSLTRPEQATAQYFALPYQTKCNLQAKGSQRKLVKVDDVLIVDIALGPESGAQLSACGVALEVMDDGEGFDDVRTWVVATIGDGYWLHGGAAAELVRAWARNQDEGIASDYVTADEGRGVQAHALSAHDSGAEARGPAGSAIGPSVAGPALGMPQLFRSEGAVAGLTPDQLAGLVAAAGLPPQRLPESSRTGAGIPSHAPAASAKAIARGVAPPHAVRGGGVGAVDEEEELIADDGYAPGPPPLPGDPQTQLLALMLQQNQQLLQHLTSARRPVDQVIEGLTSTADGSGSQGSSSLRGCAARESWLRLIRDHGPEVQSSFRTRLAQAVQLPSSALPPAALRSFFEQRVPLGSQRQLTCFSMIIARMWELLELGDQEGLATLICLSAIFAEQTALDGRTETAWLMTGLAQPAFNITGQNRTRNHAEPWGLLTDPAWLHANLAYLKDMDYFQKRQQPPPPRPHTKDEKEPKGRGRKGKDKPPPATE